MKRFDFSTAVGAFRLGVAIGIVAFGLVCVLRILVPPSAPATSPAPTGPTAAQEAEPSAPTPTLLFPVPGGSTSGLENGFAEMREGGQHGAVDIAAERGTAVLAATEGVIERLSTSSRGGTGLYLRASTGGTCCYYAHLDRYALGLAQGQRVERGQLLGYVGTSGNAPSDAPHLHFAVLQTEGDQMCSQGTPVDPSPLLEAPSDAETIPSQARP